MNSSKRPRTIRGWCIAASAALVVALSGCGSASTQSAAAPSTVDTVLKLPDLKGQTIVLNTIGGVYGDVVKKDLVAPFEAATGAKVTVTTNCCESFLTQVQSNQFAGDVVLGSSYGPVQGWANQGVLKKDPRLAQIAQARGLGSDEYQDDVVTAGYYGIVMAWNTKAGDNHPKSWADFFDTSKFKGTRGLYSWGFGDLEAALLGNGTPGSSLYPLNVDKGFDELTTLRKNAPVHVFSTDADQVNQLASGENDYTVGFSSVIMQGITKGLPLDMTFNQAVRVGMAVSIPSTARNVDGAVALIDFYMQPKVQAAIAKDTGISPAYAKAAQLVEPSLQKYMVTDPSNIGQTVKQDNTWWEKNGAPTYARFAKWASGS